MAHCISFYRPQFKQRLSHRIWSLYTSNLSLPQSFIVLIKIFNQLLWRNILWWFHIVWNASCLIYGWFYMLTLICNDLTIIWSQCFNRKFIISNLLSRIYWVTHFPWLLKLNWKCTNNRLQFFWINKNYLLALFLLIFIYLPIIHFTFL